MPQKWVWYTRIDDTIIVGAMPFKSMIEDLKGENVGGIVCCVEEFEWRYGSSLYDVMTPKDWAAENIRFHHIPIEDFTGYLPTMDLSGQIERPKVHKAINFIDEVAGEGKSVYIHCKAGRTRSVTIAASYLMHKYDYFPNVAWELVKKLRPQARIYSPQWRMLNEYRRYLDAEKSGRLERFDVLKSESSSLD
uniref:Uncharacterized protein n=1 Tax=Acrobeloides nanus TaxID=290746 RepID=A0A914E984_9BILA